MLTGLEQEKTKLGSRMEQVVVDIGEHAWTEKTGSLHLGYYLLGYYLHQEGKILEKAYMTIYSG